jgi:predicted transcriptional regulator
VGLESQLLVVTIQHEHPELEARKTALLAREEELKLQLVEVEAALLQALASSQGNVLEDRALLASLAQAKSKVIEISAALEGSETAVAGASLPAAEWRDAAGSREQCQGAGAMPGGTFRR